jgi:hypothetical protein
MDTNQEAMGLNNVAPLPKGFKPQGTAAELRMLEQECAFLNNPAISGDKKGEKPPTALTAAELTPTVTGKAELIPVGSPLGAPPSPSPVAPQDGPGATMVFADPVLENVAPTPIAQPTLPVPVAPSTPAPQFILLTGKTGVGKSFLASRGDALVLELDDEIRKVAKQVLGNIADGPQADALVETIYQWGNGQVNQQYPLTPARLLVSHLAASLFPSMHYGSPGCWVESLVERAKNLSHDADKQVIVTGVTSVEDFKALIAAGFRHYHVVCSAASYLNRPKRKGANDNLALALDKDITAKISQQRQGERLRCIWSDGGVPHPRLFSVEQWLQAIHVNTEPITPGGLGEIAFE